MDVCQVIKKEKIIMAVRSDDLDEALKSDKSIIFLLKSDILSAPEKVKKCKQAGKIVFVHVDLMEGLAKDETALKFIAQSVGCDGIISTKPAVIKMASALGLKTIFRIFLVDSQGMESAFSTLTKLKPDAVEIMPGVMGEVIRKFSAKVPSLIAGGMVQEKRHVINGIESGAIGVSTSNAELWKLSL